MRPLSKNLPLVHDAWVVAVDGSLRSCMVVELDEGDALVGRGVLVTNDMARDDVAVDFEVGLDRLRGGLSGYSSDEHGGVHYRARRRRLRWGHCGCDRPEESAQSSINTDQKKTDKFDEQEMIGRLVL